MKKVALATCVSISEPDIDEPILLEALERRGARVRMLGWDHPTETAEPDELVVVRSTWNYYSDLDRFLGWVERTAQTTRLLNPSAIIRGNVRKTYLRDLAARGIDVVPTEFVERGRGNGHTPNLADIFARWPAIVIKPVVSAGSFLTKRFSTNERAEAEDFLARMIAERDAMVQPWLSSVDAHGERSLVYIDGELTHAIRKSPRWADGEENVSPGAVTIAPDERAAALRVLESLAGQEVLYARIDVVRDDDGVVRLMELELIEPSLYLKQYQPAAERLADAILQRV